MTRSLPEIEVVPVDAITVINPRSRNKRIFNELVTSIARLGLKKPITVSRRASGTGYDLVCGQGRLEAFMVLGQNVIPAIVVEATEEDCYVMSLVENLARRNHSSLELMREIGVLRERGYNMNEIAAKTDFSQEYVYAICYLLDHGESRLLAAVDRGVMPPSIAMEICKAKEGDVQKALSDAYEKKALPGNQIIAIRRIIEERNQRGKSVQRHGGHMRVPRKVTADALIRAYHKETGRQRLMVRKAELAQSRLIFIVNALKRLLEDENFTNLLRAEALTTLPRPLAERLEMAGG